MKKYLLFIISMLCVSIGTWAQDPTATISGGSGSLVIITTNGDADLSTLSGSTALQGNWGSNTSADNGVKVSGPITQEGLDVINSMMAQNNQMYYGTNKYFYLNEATLSGTITSLPTGTSTSQYPTETKFAYCILPAETEMPTTIPSTYEYVYSGCESDGTIRIHVNQENASISQFTPEQISAASTIIVTGSAKDNFISNMTNEAKAKLAFDGSASITTTSSSNVQAQLEAYLISKGKTASSATTDVVSLTIYGPLTSEDVTYLSTLTSLTTLNLTGVTSFGAGISKSTINAAVSGATVIYPASYTIDDCTVTIDMGKAMGDDLATILTQAKTALGSTSICTLIVTGPVTNNDLIALGGTNMTGATRIDLSNATLGSGVTIENIQLPTSLTSLILPKGLTVSVGLKSKLTAATNLQYAYSPSTGTTGVSPDTETISVADYVWVNLAGGLDLALTNESTLNNSKYVKVASDVALSATDITFNATGRLPNVKYFDMRDANMGASIATESFKSPTSTDYRIILPDNWTTEQMSAFAGHLGDVFWTMAAIYSYSGTTLKIYEATDTKYMPAALSNHRIVVDGTTAIEVVGPTLGTQLLEALNGADSDVKTITISASSIDGLTFTNPNITTLNVTGLNRNTAQLNVDGCAALKNLNVTGSTISSVDASATSLEAVNLNGSTISNNVDLSGSGLKTLTTNSETWIKGDLHLESTASFTSFASTAKFGVNNATNGNIYLNHSGVSTVDLQSVQFQNPSSKIHIDSTEGEGDTPLTNLNADGQLTIYIPTGFDRTRLHPYSSATLDDNIAELAASGAFTLDDGCKIDYNATTGIATVTALHPGCLKALMEKNDNYGKFVDGAIFTFDASCKLNAEDLAALAGKEGYGSYGNFNWNYVDLYNLPASYTIDETTVNYADVITAAINILRAENWQYKGLLLPKAVTTLGTTLIMDAENADPKLATCSQFIAYSGAINDQALTASYIYKAADDWGISFDERLTKMMDVMKLHSDIKGTTTNWSVSTNSATPLDLSSIPASVTIGGNSINTSKLETINNDMVGGVIKPSIYAYPAYEGVMNTVTTYTGIGGTPDLEILKVTGPLSDTDIASINSFEHGPRVFDISGATTTITKDMLESITNANIEYIILPASMTKDVVCGANYKDGLKNGKLKAVISSTSTNLVAYVNTPGSLAEARYYATGGSVDANTGLITPTQTGMQNITLAGKLNAADIAANTAGKKVGSDGQWIDGGGNLVSIALSSEQGTITTIDLEDAVFPRYSDMNFSYAGLASISNVTLPSAMNRIPADCFKGITSIHELCIPYNYEYIENAAFYLAELSHITTTDKNGALIDNGENTFTFSKNLKEIGQVPSSAITGEGDNSYPTPLAEPVFFSYAIHGLTDVYVLRTGYEDGEEFNPTKCYRNAFGAGPTYGWGGFDGSNVYCREKYMNGDQLFTVLHFPDKASVSNDEDKYNKIKKTYTDPTKVYTKKDQTGAVDANGESPLWPTFAELCRSYNQAVRGLIWEDWTYTDKNQKEGNIEGNVITATPGNPTDVSRKENADHYIFTDYVGWHEFVLSLATYVAPDEKVVDNEVIRTYEEDDWYTFCIPFDMTEQEVALLLGIPRSTDEDPGTDIKIVNNLKTSDSKGNSAGKVTENVMPTIVTLKQVTRSSSTNTVSLRCSEDMGSGANKFKYYSPSANDYISNGYVDLDGDSGEDEDEKIMIRAGYPYIIRPYTLCDPETGVRNAVPSNNLGKQILTRYAFKMMASAINHSETREAIGGQFTKEKSNFAKPYEGHKVQAYSDDPGSVGPLYRDAPTNAKPYNYTFVGQYWTQYLPQNCFYMSGHKWYHNTYPREEGYYWYPYTCLILTSNEDGSGLFRYDTDNTKYGETNYAYTIIPEEIGKDAKEHAVFDKEMQIRFKDGFDDSFTSNARVYHFVFDEDIMDFDEDGQTTGIDVLDGQHVAPVRGEVYNMAGQHVGNSLNGLPKGMYIVNGKKIVIR